MDTAKLVLRLAPALVMIIFGISQFLNPLAWVKFVPTWIPMDQENFMKLHALANIGLGILLATGWQLQYVLWIVLVWWLSILPFSYMQDWTLAVRDAAITASLVALLLME